MSRVAKSPISVPKNVEINLNDNVLTVKGEKGSLSFDLTGGISVNVQNDQILVEWDKENKLAMSQAGTTRAIVNNMIVGVSAGFEKKMSLVGVGYRAQAKDNVLSLSLGFSHPVDYEIPNGIVVETPSQTDIIIKGSDKQKVGQVAAEIRAYRPPEPYKGKGVRFVDEQVARKEAKKK